MAFPGKSRSARRGLATLAGALGALCTAPAPLAEEPVPSFSFSSPAFEPGAAIPRRHTCQGEDVSPELRWSGLPEETVSLALVVHDPDVPDPKAPTRTWVHWVLYDIPPNTTGLLEGATPAQLPPGTQSGLNDWKRTGYGGPCPPVGRHRYVHRLYALDALLGLDRPTKSGLEAAMEGHILASAELLGTYQKD